MGKHPDSEAGNGRSQSGAQALRNILSIVGGAVILFGFVSIFVSPIGIIVIGAFRAIQALVVGNMMLALIFTVVVFGGLLALGLARGVFEDFLRG